MPPDRNESLKLPAWAVPILLSALIAAVVAWTQLGGKEDASAHAADVASVRKDHSTDVVELQAQITTVKTDAEKQAIRDSASHAEVMRLLLDIQRQVKK